MSILQCLSVTEAFLRISKLKYNYNVYMPHWQLLVKKPHLAMHVSKNCSYFELKNSSKITSCASYHFMAHYEKHPHIVIINPIKVYTILNTLIS